MRKVAWVAAALAFALAGCNSASGATDDEKPKASTSTKAENEAGSADEDASTAGPKPATAPSGTSSGTWDIDTHECSAMMESGDSAIKIQQTDRELKVYFAPAWASYVDGSGKLTVGGEAMGYETTAEQGHDWIVVTTSNDDFGGMHDVIANAQTIKVGYSGDGGTKSQSFSLRGANGVMDELRKCAGL